MARTVHNERKAIPEANDLVARCGAVMGAATQQGEARPLLLRVIAGEKWTQQQLNQWQEELRGLAEAHRRLGVIARRETGIEVADLFASNESKPPNKASEEQGNGATCLPETVKARGMGNKKAGHDDQPPG